MVFASLSRRLAVALAAALVILAALVLAIAPTFSQAGPAATPTPVPGFAPPPANPPPAVTPIGTVHDLAPSVQQQDKWSAVFQFPDGHQEMYLLATNDVSAVRSQLPSGATLVTTIPPRSLVGKEAPRKVTPPAVRVTPPTSGQVPLPGPQPPVPPPTPTPVR